MSMSTYIHKAAGEDQTGQAVEWGKVCTQGEGAQGLGMSITQN